MNQNSRTTNVFRNILGGVGGQIFASILAFVCRTYFIKLLSQTYLGVNGLFSDILVMLSLAELGIGPAIVFSMYKPIAENDELHVAKLMNFYKTAYRIVAAAVAVIGLSLVPFLDFLIKDPGDIEDLRLIFVLILSNTVVSYLLAYKGSMLQADQKAYVCVIFSNVFVAVNNIAQIFVLIFTGNYILYLVVGMIGTFLGNLAQAIYVNKKYPFLVKYKRERIDKTERGDILKRVRGMMMHKLGGFVLNSTDNLIISKFIGIVTVGIYSNYLMIIKLVKSYVSQVTGALSASVGNLIASETKEKSYDVFKVTLFVFFWVYGFCFICFWNIFPAFIKLWIGENFLLDSKTLMLVLIVFYLYGVHGATDSFTNATGLFYETRWKPVVECISNIAISIWGVIKFGLPGIFIGTIAAYVLTGWIEPLYLYMMGFKKNFIRYLLRYMMYFIITILLAFGVGFICNYFETNSAFLNLVIRMAASILLSNLAIMVIFFKTDEMKQVMKYALQTIRRRKK